jgi:hypothetical protein
LDVYRGRLSLRKLRVYIDRLPAESWTKTELRNAAPDDVMAKATGEHRPDKAPWSGVEMLLAALRDELVLNRMVAIAATGAKPPAFTPTPRPGVPPTGTSGQRRALSDEQRRALDPRMRQQQKEA